MKKNFIIKNLDYRKNINLIASESFINRKIFSFFPHLYFNKYIEGQIGKRYYRGSNNIDEFLIKYKDKLTKLTNFPFSNIQALSGGIANFCILKALLSSDDYILTLNLKAGGHLSHMSKFNYTKDICKVINYNLDDLGFIDYNNIRILQKKYSFKMIILGYSVGTYDIDYSLIRKILGYNCLIFLDMSHFSGLALTKLMNFPNEADIIMFTTHKILFGVKGAIILSKKETIAKKIDRAIFPGLQGGPNTLNMIHNGFNLLDFDYYKRKELYYQVIKNANYFLQLCYKNDLFIINNKTYNHMILLDTLKNFKINGNIAAEYLEKINIIVNSNSFFYSPINEKFGYSGIRIGFVCVTQIGFQETEIKNLFIIIVNFLKEISTTKHIDILKYKKEVDKILGKKKQIEFII